MLLFAMVIFGSFCRSSIADNNVKLYYYTSPLSPAIQLQDIHIQAANINNTKQLKIICHGATANLEVDWYGPLINAYLDKGHQVIAVDWGILAYSPDVISSINYVGNLIGTYIISIHFVFKFPLDRIHFVGHSVGAHIGGYAGRLISQILALKIGRLTGLDPVTNLTLQVFGRTTMTPKDASFVDVIHTMAGTGGIGYSAGTADFYPNGGGWQPGCENIIFAACSHVRAPWLFVESIKSNGFLSKKCDSWDNYKSGKCNFNSEEIMGEKCSLSAFGDYYLSTNGASPYAQG